MTGSSFTTRDGLAIAWAEGSRIGVYATGPSEDAAIITARETVRFLESQTEVEGFHRTQVSAGRAVTNGPVRRAAWRVR
jgi:hypothetical protein